MYTVQYENIVGDTKMLPTMFTSAKLALIAALEHFAKTQKRVFIVRNAHLTRFPIIVGKVSENGYWLWGK